MARILVVDDEPLIVEIVEETLLEDGHEVLKAYSGEEALIVVDRELPDLILLDLMLPGMSGYEVSRLMQQEARFNHIPIIMLTARTAPDDRVAGYQGGADDYITKPFDTEELLLRVRAQLQHLSQAEKSRLTGLPGSQAIQQTIQERAGTGQDWAIIYTDLDFFTAYNEVYSFAQGNELIKQVAQCLTQAIKEQGTPHDFLGHAGGGDFVIVTNKEQARAVAERGARLFNQAGQAFFNETDRANGWFHFVNHAGKSVNLPLVTLSYDIVDNSSQ